MQTIGRRITPAFAESACTRCRRRSCRFRHDPFRGLSMGLTKPALRYMDPRSRTTPGRESGFQRLVADHPAVRAPTWPEGCTNLAARVVGRCPTHRPFPVTFPCL
eukprot:474782-Prymnesium_polylepis.1